MSIMPYYFDTIERPTCREWNAYSLIRYAQEHYNTDPGLDSNMIDFSFTGTILTFDTDGNITGETTKELLSSDEFVRMIKSKFFSYKFLTPFYLDYSTNKYVDSTDDDNYSNVTMAYRQLYQIWQIWAKDNKKNFGDLYNALFQKYNPINNYDKHSHITLENKGSETNTTDYTGGETNTLEKKGTEKEELTKSGKEATTFAKGVELENDYKATFDQGSADLYKVATKEIEGTDSDTDVAYKDNTEVVYGGSGADARKDSKETSFGTGNNARKDINTQAYNDRSDTTTKEFDDRIDETIEHTFGNIGVTTTQQMAMSSFDLAELAHLKEYIVNDFVHRFLEL